MIEQLPLPPVLPRQLHGERLSPIPSFETMRVIGAHLERVLGPCGSNLLDVCRQSGVNITVRPEIWGGHCHDFVLGFDGPAAAVEVGRTMLMELMADDDNGPVSDDDLYEDSLPEIDSLDGPGQEVGEEQLLEVEEIKLTCEKGRGILYCRPPGERGVGLRTAMMDLQKRTGLVELGLMKDVECTDTTWLRARGNSESLARLRDVLSERAEARAGVLEEFLEVHGSAYDTLFSCSGRSGLSGPSLAHRVESMCGALLSKQGCLRCGDLVKVSIWGTASQIEHAKTLLLANLPNNGRRDDGKVGKGSC